EHFSFVDTSEIYFGLPERSFNSFKEAAQEAAMSRLYGGIHFRDACEEGFKQGTRVAEFVLNKVGNFQP
ncbi:MAG TPA: haloperoxidase, partial [Chryseosolibacter sp.]|nr:haloperoxidase [Chryseosolibacter sp.]